MNKEPIEVIRQHDDNITSSISHSKRNFPNMPQLYLELMENKEKIHPSMVNKDYHPETASEISDVLSVNNDFISKNPISQSSSLPIQSTSTNDDDDEDEDEDEENDDEDDEEDDEDENDNEDDEDTENDESSSIQSVSSSTNEYTETTSSKLNPHLTNKLYSLLRDDDDPIESRESFFKTPSESNQQNTPPPKLSDLEKSGAIKRDKHIPDYSTQNVSAEELDELKRELLFKFELLKKGYQNMVDIPEFTMHADYNEMKRAYDHTVRRLSLDSNVESYKTYLIGGFMIIEFILGNWLKFDMQGFTQQQILNMNKYDRLLIELGEKNYVPEGSEWPVEIRLLFMILLNAAVFIVGKLIMKKTGTNFMSMMNGMNDFHRNEPKRKMRGPNIDINSPNFGT